MSIFKTTLNVESTNFATATVNFTSTNNTDLTDDIVFSKITVNTIGSLIYPNNHGAKGSFLYVKSSASNPKHTSINIGNEGGEIATLYAGEYSLIQLSKEMGPLYANATHGTAELEYFFGSRGEELGESVLIHYKNTTSEKWEYFIMDSNTCIPGPVVEPIIGDNTEWSTAPEVSTVKRKGYVLWYQNSTTLDSRYIFINRRGLIINEVTGTPTYNYNVWGGYENSILLTWLDDGVGHAVHFDGDSCTEHTFENITDIYVEWNWDQCSADGTFPVYIEGYGEGLDEAVFLIKGADKTLIKITDPSNNWSNTYAYEFGNFIVVETVTEGNQYDEIETLEIFRTDGTLLKTVDIGNIEALNKDYYFYGSGKLQVVYQEFDTNKLTFLNYNQLTGKLIGDDLNWTSSNLTNYEVICDPYSSLGGMDYKPESVAIIKYYDENTDSDSFLYQDTDGDLEVTYIINNDLEQRNYVVPNTEDRYYVSNNGNSIWLHATDKDFVLLSADSRNSGPLVATRFTSGAQPTRFNLINDLSIYVINDVNNYNVQSRAFGDFRYLGVKNDTNDNQEFIIYDSNILDKVSVYWDDYDTTREFNTFYISDGQIGKNWYFNISTKKWVLIPTYYNSNYTCSEGSEYPISISKILLRRTQVNPTSESLHGRIITRGNISNEKELLKVGNTPGAEIWNWYLEMGAETIVLSYQETSNSNWKVRVFDLNLNFLYEVDTEKNNFNSSSGFAFGNINFWVFNNYNNNDNVFYNFGKLLNKFAKVTPNNFGTYQNNTPPPA